LPLEVVLVWTFYGLVTTAIVVTYSRIPARELYHVSHGGLAGGASRALVFSNFSTALAVLAIIALLFDRFTARIARLAAVVAALLCAAVFWPGVVSQADLDAKPVNVLAAVGVGLAIALTVYAALRAGVSVRPWRRDDWGRLVLAVALVLLAAPWIAAELGFFLDGVPLLGSIFQTGKHIRDVQGLPAFPPAVHHGHHHGMDGLLLVLTALLLSRAVGSMRSIRLRSALTAYLALMFCYGVGNIANDFWTEQVVKRGWTTWQIPNVLEPRATVAWAIIVIAAAVIWTGAMLRERSDQPIPPGVGSGGAAEVGGAAPADP
jgi:Mn2+/Fe2+ NRAMP family transporter